MRLANGAAHGGANGTAHYCHKEAPQFSVWRTLSRCLPVRDADSDSWWQLTGRQLAVLLEAAGYPVEKQYEALLLHYHWTVPCLGPSPRSYGVSKSKWRSTLQSDGTPMRFSWRWNTQGGAPPQVQYDVEPISQFAGMELDPLNQQAARELLHRLASTAVPAADLGRASHFLGALFEHDSTRCARELGGGDASTSCLVSLDLARGGGGGGDTGLTAHLQPRRPGAKGGLVPLEQWEAAIRALDPDNAALAALHDFFAGSREGRLLTPFCLAVDTAADARAPLKLYLRSPHSSFASVREVMTLGGRAGAAADADLAGLADLVGTVAALPDGYAEDAELPHAAGHAAVVAADEYDDDDDAAAAGAAGGNVYAFDIAPGRALPAVELHMPLARLAAASDFSLACRLTEWMASRGRGAYCHRYMRMLDALADHRHLHDGLGLQTFLGCRLAPDGDLDVTSYLAPEAFHPSRLAPRRPTRRRGDDF